MPNRYRKKSAEVEAVQWTGENREAVAALLGAHADSGVYDEAAQEFRLWIGTVRLGHYLVREGDSVSIQSPDQFEATYEPVALSEEEQPAPSLDREDVEQLKKALERLIADCNPDAAVKEQRPYLHGRRDGLRTALVQLRDLAKRLSEGGRGEASAFPRDGLSEWLKLMTASTQRILRETDPDSTDRIRLKGILDAYCHVADRFAYEATQPVPSRLSEGRGQVPASEYTALADAFKLYIDEGMDTLEDVEGVLARQLGSEDAAFVRRALEGGAAALSAPASDVGEAGK